MQIAHADEVPEYFDGVGVRVAKVVRQIMLCGDPASPGNFKFGLYRQYGEMYSPRHRHNFCQFRFRLEGTADYSSDGTMTPGMIGYFPEGVYYGPQRKTSGDAYVAALQFGGPSGSGLLTPKQIRDAKQELLKFGVFEKGVYHRNEGVPGKKNMDGYEAVWEQVAGRKLVYPEAQYGAPVLMQLENYAWLPLDGSPGVSVKAMATFTDCNIPCAAYLLEPGSTFVAGARGVYLVLSGHGALEGDTFRKYTALYLDTDETAAFKADQTSEILLMGLPNVRDMLPDQMPVLHREAAE